MFAKPQLQKSREKGRDAGFGQLRRAQFGVVFAENVSSNRRGETKKIFYQLRSIDINMVLIESRM
jgi:hypothetical protein